MPTHLRLQVFLFTLTRFVFHTMYRMVYPFLAVFGRGMGVELAAISLAVSSRSFMGAFGPLLASTLEQYGRKTGILSGTLIFTIGASLVVFWPTYPVFFVSLLLTSMGSYLFLPTMQAYLGEHVPYRQRGFTLAVTELSWSLSFILGIPLMGFLIARGGWAAPFPLLTLLGVVTFILLAWRLPKTPQSNPGNPGLGILRNFHTVLSLPAARAGLAMSLLLTATVALVTLIFGVWLEDNYGLQVAALGAAAAVIGLSELSGEGLSGWLVDRLGKERSIATGILLNLAAVIALPFLGKTLPGSLLGLFFFYLTFEFAIVSSVSLVTAIYPPARVTLMSINMASLSIGHGLGALLSAPLYRAGGMLACALVAAGFNLLTLFFLRQIEIKEQ
jgi:MFS transporter, DHA1 family, inner membrane transport protein